MAVDTLLKRFTMLQLAGEPASIPPMVRFTNGPLGPSARQMALWLYTGIALAEPSAPGAAGSQDSNWLRQAAGRLMR
jgi:hypothetical protein